MAGYFDDNAIHDLRNGFDDVHGRFNELRGKFLARHYKSARAGEFAYHGFCRRLDTMIHCIDKVFAELPPELDAIPSRDSVMDATTTIQAFVFNAFGCLDNLAWIWVEEKPVMGMKGGPLDPKRVGLGKRSTEIRTSFSPDFVAYLDKRQSWVDNHLKCFCDALAHRIPLYIPPFIVDPKHIDEYNRLETESGAALGRLDFEAYDKLQTQQKALGFYRPWMTHSASEKAPVAIFHRQMLQDYLTIDEFGRAMLTEIGRQLDKVP
jgi:hypothetical protein